MKCCIVDANVVGEVFGSNPPEAGMALFRWIQQGDGGLVVGGKLAEELRISVRLSGRSGGQRSREMNAFNSWLQLAWQSGRVRNLDLSPDASESIRNQTEMLGDRKMLQSDDPHIIALAIVSGARLLYSHDRMLQADFRDSRLVNRPRGKVYSTEVNRDLTQSHRTLMREAPRCK